MKNKNIVLLGGGFGGVQAALKLSKKLKYLKTNNKYNIILIDKHDYHTFTPLLYEIATTSRNTSTYEELKSLVTFKFDKLFENRDIQFKKGNVVDIHLEDKIIDMEESKLEFDHLILGLGSEVNDYGIEGIEEHSLKLKTFDDAVAIRNKIMFEIEEKNRDETINIVIGGAGSTGVELAGEIRKWACRLEENKDEHKCFINVKLIQGGNTILPGFKDKIIKKSGKRLEDLGVDIQTKKFIEKITENKVITSDNHSTPYDIMIWTGGIKASSITGKLPIEKEKSGRVEIINKLECIPNNKDLRSYKNIYAIGDISCTYDPETGETTPPVARVAMIQGRIAAYNIIEDIKLSEGLINKTSKKVYNYKKYPYIVPVGGKYAVARIGSTIFSGISAWIFKGIVELNYFLSILSPVEAFKKWFKGFKIFIQNDRLG